MRLPWLRAERAHPGDRRAREVWPGEGFSLAARSPPACHQGQHQRSWGGTGIRLRLPQEGPRREGPQPGRAPDRRQRRRAGLVPSAAGCGGRRLQLRGPDLQGGEGAHLVGGSPHRLRPGRLRYSRQLLQGAKEARGWQRPKGRPPRVLDHAPGHGAYNDLQQGRDGPLLGRGPCGWDGTGRHRAGDRHRERGGHLRVAQPGACRPRRVLLPTVARARVGVRLLPHQLHRSLS